MKDTPDRLYHADRAAERFTAVAQRRDALGTQRLRLISSYSVKTNPRAELLALAHVHGFFAEVISGDELAWASDCGFPSERIVYNGPVALRATPPAGPLAIAFADSLEAFRDYAALGLARIAGVRLRPERIDSRFGVPAEETSALLEAIAAAAPPALGVSFHVRHEDYGAMSWRDLVEHMLSRAAALERESGVPLVWFDIGGGWEPAALDAALASDFPWLIERVGKRLKHARDLVFEPGQSIATPAESLVTSILEVRTRASHREIIIDAGYPELPQMHTYSHPVCYETADGWIAIAPGVDRIAGRTCLEYDIVRNDVALPDTIRVGDRLSIGSCGSYDTSMAFRFARGAGAQTSLTR
ncbi:MAG: diaminopimelate decarboxylase [Candidatus Velthaea sp.]